MTLICGVIVVGAAIATMDALMLKQNLPSSVQLSTTVFGLPRGGDQAYANFIDSAVRTSSSHGLFDLMILEQHSAATLSPSSQIRMIQYQLSLHVFSGSSIVRVR